MTPLDFITPHPISRRFPRSPFHPFPRFLPPSSLIISSCQVSSGSCIPNKASYQGIGNTRFGVARTEATPRTYSFEDLSLMQLELPERINRTTMRSRDPNASCCVSMQTQAITRDYPVDASLSQLELPERINRTTRRSHTPKAKSTTQQRFDHSISTQSQAAIRNGCPVDESRVQLELPERINRTTRRPHSSNGATQQSNGGRNHCVGAGIQAHSVDEPLTQPEWINRTTARLRSPTTASQQITGDPTRSLSAIRARPVDESLCQLELPERINRTTIRTRPASTLQQRSREETPVVSRAFPVDESRSQHEFPERITRTTTRSHTPIGTAQRRAWEGTPWPTSRAFQIDESFSQLELPQRINRTRRGIQNNEDMTLPPPVYDPARLPIYTPKADEIPDLECLGTEFETRGVIEGADDSNYEDCNSVPLVII